MDLDRKNTHRKTEPLWGGTHVGGERVWVAVRKDKSSLLLLHNEKTRLLHMVENISQDQESARKLFVSIATMFASGELS